MADTKGSKRGRPSKGGQGLSAQIILNSAKNLMRIEGKVPSIRALAAQLGVDAMAIYHYYKNKDALLEAIAVSLIEEIYQPAGNQVWQDEIIQLAMSYLALLHRYSGLLQTLLSMKKPESPAQVFSERFNLITQELDLETKTKEDGMNLLVDYLHGFSFAMSCHTTGDALTIESIQGPLELLIHGLHK